MVISCLKNTSIQGISVVLPNKELSLLDDGELYNGDKKKVERVIKSSGFLNRRVVEEDTTTADLCESAANDLISKLNIDKSTIDALLFVSYTPDYLMPATSYVLHNKLGLGSDCLCMDIPQACSGYVLGLFQAAMLINSGYKKVLLLVGDSFSKFSDMFNNHTAPIFGDAGTATLIEYNQNDNPMYFNIQSDSNYYDALICNNGGFRNIPKIEDFYEDGKYKYNSKMDGGRIFEFTINNISPIIEDLIKNSNNTKEDIDYFVLHQANKFILENIARQLDIDVNKVPMSTISKYGNQCGASIPAAIADTLQNEVSTQKNKILICGFGVGLSCASAIINLDKIYCSNINNYRSEE